MAVIARTIRIAALAAGGVAIALLATTDPATSPLYPPCLFRLATGWLCPGCGAARATHALLHGDVIAAWTLNPALIAVAPVIAADLRDRLRQEPMRGASGPRSHYIRALAAAIVVFGVVRNL